MTPKQKASLAYYHLCTARLHEEAARAHRVARRATETAQDEQNAIHTTERKREQAQKLEARACAHAEAVSKRACRRHLHDTDLIQASTWNAELKAELASPLEQISGSFDAMEASTDASKAHEECATHHRERAVKLSTEAILTEVPPIEVLHTGE